MNTPRLRLRAPHPPAREAGFTLIVALIFLVLVSLIATVSIRSVGLQSRMSAASVDRSLVYQSAESGLREAEARAAAATDANFPAANCAAGYCAAQAATAAPRWADESNAGWKAVEAPVSANAPAVVTIVEEEGNGQNFVGCSQSIPPLPNCLTPRYRVTSRSNAADRAAVILQSEVATQ